MVLVVSYWLFFFVVQNTAGKHVTTNHELNTKAKLWLLFILLTAVATLAQECTNGFPDRLAIRAFRNDSSARLIPEMKFTCNGTIVGYTVAGIKSGTDNENAVIQVWRENASQPGVYHKIGPGIRINEGECTASSADPARVFKCRLDGDVNPTSVQIGDILGLDLPPAGDGLMGALAFTTVSSGPTNYIFEQRPLSSPVALNDSTSINQDLPQVALEIESGTYASMTSS